VEFESYFGAVKNNCEAEARNYSAVVIAEVDLPRALIFLIVLVVDFFEIFLHFPKLLFTVCLKHSLLGQAPLVFDL
jgi:hypothetical protein